MKREICPLIYEHHQPIWCKVSSHWITFWSKGPWLVSSLSISEQEAFILDWFVPLPSSLPVSAEGPLSWFVSNITNGSWMGWPSSVIIGAVINLPLPTTGNIWRHSSFHLIYCILKVQHKNNFYMSSKVGIRHHQTSKVYAQKVRVITVLNSKLIYLHF